MAPSIYRRGEVDTISTQTTQPEESSANGVVASPWLIIVFIVVGVLVVVAVFEFFVFRYVRRRRAIARANGADPLGRPKLRVRKMSARDQHASEEMERAMMIRKSLASRNSSWSTSSFGGAEYQQVDREDSEALAPRETGPYGPRATPGVYNLEMGIHPAFLPHPPLALPPRSRAPPQGVKPPLIIIPAW
ncbi:hypothetical protein GGR54DRAFT_369491 [Hypoxylon sp. NC1633]|nr:hypothetical protein GGR54DRAFT_369491 [Hypoxylon sp. NC1633]